MLKEATQLGLERKFDEAIARLDQLVKLRPDDQALRVYLGGMYAAAGRVAEAAAILDPVLAADPSNFDATMHLASGYLFAGNLDRAAAYATRALALRPSNADAAKLQGMVHWQQGRTREAEALLNEAANADPRDPMPHLWMGMILGQQMRYVEARQRFETALSKNPLLGDALIGVADTFAATGAFAQAEVAIKRAEQAEPNNPRLPAARDRILARPRRHDEGRRRDPALSAQPRARRHRTPAPPPPRRRRPRHRGSKKSPRRAALTSSIAPGMRRATRCPRSWAAAPPSSTWMAIETSTSCSCKAAASRAPPGTPAGHRLYRNRGDGAFDDVSDGSGVAAVPGYGMGAATGDYDNDGDVDVYITNLGANVLLQNDGKGRFVDVTRTAGVAGSGWSTSATFADVDADGDLDLFVTRYLDWRIEIERECYSLTGVADYCSPKNYDAPTSDLLFRNNGNGTFTDISRAAGLATAVGNGLGVIADDVNGDGRLDLFVANDGTPNHLWINQGGARFAESALMAGVAIDQDGAPKAGMGVHAADLDDDGDNELIVMNLDTESDSFFRNEGKFFVDDTVQVGLRVVSRRFTRFGVALLDFDNDGLIDLYEANGRVGLQAETFATDPYAEPEHVAGVLDDRCAVGRGGSTDVDALAAVHALQPHVAVAGIEEAPLLPGRAAVRPLVDDGEVVEAGTLHVDGLSAVAVEDPVGRRGRSRCRPR